MRKHVMLLAAVVLAFLSPAVSHSAITFTDIDAGLQGVTGSSLAWGDYDNDGLLDLVVAGMYYDQSMQYSSKIYRNNGSAFTDIGAMLDFVNQCKLAWGDYDNDGDLDLALAGQAPNSGYYTNIYRNNNGTFEKINAGLDNFKATSLSWVDFDNDGDLDLSIAGDNLSSPTSFEVYRNANGTFTRSNIESSMQPVPHKIHSVAWGDYDNDGDPDMLVTGEYVYEWRYLPPGYYTPITNTCSRIYRNDDGKFIDINAGLRGIKGDACWVDYDNDGDLDLALSGTEITGGYGSQVPASKTKIYTNNSGTFSDSNVSFSGTEGGSIAWGDCDNDGDLDLVIVGSSGSGIYCNDGTGFTYTNAGLPVITCYSLALGDYDNDSDLDVALSGSYYDGAAVSVSRIYRNDGSSANTPPSFPTGLSTTATADTITFKWNAASDAETPAAGLSYNLRVGTSPGANDVFSGMADSTTGLRWLPAIGNAQKRLSWTLKRDPRSKYYWSVQAIDSVMAGSPWAEEQVFPGMNQPVNESLAPTNGTLTTSSKLTFTATYSDIEGSDDIKGCYLIINRILCATNSIFLCYSHNTNKLYLRNDADNSWGTGYTPGSSAVLQNNQCKVYCAETTVTTSANQLTVNWKIEIKPSMASRDVNDVNGWMLVSDDENLQDGWDQMGDYSIVLAPTAPINISLIKDFEEPLNVGIKCMMITNYSDLNGYRNVHGCYLLMNSTLSGINGVYLCFSENTGKLYLRNDANTTWGTGVVPGSSTVLQNSQVKVHCNGTSVIFSPKNLTVRWMLEFKSPVAGKTWPCWMLVTDDQGLRDGWDKMGTCSFY